MLDHHSDNIPQAKARRQVHVGRQFRHPEVADFRGYDQEFNIKRVALYRNQRKDLLKSQIAGIP